MSRVAAAAIGVALALLLIGAVEVYCRFTEDTNDFAVQDPRVGWRHLPYQRFTDKRGNRIQLNRYGLRGEDLDLTAPAEERRILCLGDSYVFGIGLRDPETFPVQLQLLASQSPGMTAFRVINGAEQGYDTHQEVEYLRHYGAAFQPDMVVLGYVLNDIGESTWDPQPTWHQWLMGYSALYRRVRREILDNTPPAKGSIRRRGVFKDNVNPAIARPLEDGSRDAWTKSLGRLEELARICSERGWGLVITIFPIFLQTDPPERPINVIRDRHAQDVLTDFCSQHGITCVDLLPVYSHSAEPVWQAEDVTHPNAHGMRLAASETFRALQALTGSRPMMDR